jgi:hypothetical protein
LHRCGKDLAGVYVNYRALRKMPKTSLRKYINLLREEVRQKKIYVVEENGWFENLLSKWFKENYHLLNFQTIFEEKTKEYMEIKARQKFFGYPDFLAILNGEVVRVELECFSSLFKYMHSPDYCEVIVCYEIDEEVPNKVLYSMKDLLGYENIINKAEIYDYLYLINDEFRNELDIIALDGWSNAIE